MDDRTLEETNSPSHDRIPIEPVRSRWTPKPEQILILESIFNSGTVNPPKDETVRIRKLLEKFGSVGDANVFYWFQNRRSRSRRRQRQMQAGLAGDPRNASGVHRTGGAINLYEPAAATSSSPASSTSSSTSSSGGFVSSSSNVSCSSSLVGDDGADDLFSISRQMGFHENDKAPTFLSSSIVSNLNYHPGIVTVFINGIPSEVPRGPIDMRAMFGQDVMLVHSSGKLVPVNEYGILLQGLHIGESYFMVSRTN